MGIGWWKTAQLRFTQYITSSGSGADSGEDRGQLTRRWRSNAIARFRQREEERPGA